VGYFSLDERGIIRKTNLTGAVLLGIERIRLINHHFGLFVSKESRPAFQAILRKVFVEKTKGSCEVALSREGDRLRFAHLEIKPAESEQECHMAAMDITERKRAEEERENTLIHLQNAMTEVKRLKGILPICAACKKIRDDQGYWIQVEVYIREHSEAQFSHGICPECREKLYPEFDLGEK
jgi:PAS domain S-box-containing protein